jgi:7-cyano-7-deazaguanine synthase
MTDPRTINQIVLLISGGLDSGALLFWAIHNGLEVFPLFIDYGQISKPGELRAVTSLLALTHTYPLKVVSIPDIASIGYQPVWGENAREENTRDYFPTRNLLLLTIASIYAFQKGVLQILIGLIADTANVLPDCSTHFLDAANQIFRVEYPNLRIEAPFIRRSKIDIVKEASRFGYRPELTFCCNRQQNHHCWRCPSCQDRYSILSNLNLIS